MTGSTDMRSLLYPGSANYKAFSKLTKKTEEIGAEGEKDLVSGVDSRDEGAGSVASASGAPSKSSTPTDPQKSKDKNKDKNVGVVGDKLFSSQSVHDGLLMGLVVLARIHGRPVNAASIVTGLPLKNGKLTEELLPRAARRAKLSAIVTNCSLNEINSMFLPVMLILKSGDVVVLADVVDGLYHIVNTRLGDGVRKVDGDELNAVYSGRMVLVAPAARNDLREKSFFSGNSKHWFWSEVSRYKWSYFEVSLVAFLSNILALVTSLFALQVYDRVVPNSAFGTLWALFAGVLVAISIEFLTQLIRSHLVDVTGRELDIKLSREIFARAISIRLECRPKYLGSFINMVKEYSSLREFFTSSTIAAITDIPFAFLFLFVIWGIGGEIVLVLVAAIPLVVIPGIVAQWPMAAWSNENLTESGVRNGLMMEALTSHETVKAVCAESHFQRLWEEYTNLLSWSGLRLRAMTHGLAHWTKTIQQVAYATVVVVGVYRIDAGLMTMGGMIACTILTSRTIAPLAQLSNILGRFQNAKLAFIGLDRLMKLPIERPDDVHFVTPESFEGAYSLDTVSFGYEQDAPPVLRIAGLTVAGGETLCLLGANGSGKSTLLRLFAGLYQPTSGQLLLDGLDIRQIEPSALRAAIGYLPQDVRLFYGTLRENMLMGLGHRPDKEILRALEFVGVENLASGHPQGLDRMIGEGGSGVSGGQCQSIGLARLILRDPQVVLMDEPTAAMDTALELRVLANLKDWLAMRTAIISTHRQPVVQLASRAVVMKAGSIVLSGSIDDVMAVLKPGGRM